jgi:RNA polymerase sigma-70 factor (ECF subfamily)
VTADSAALVRSEFEDLAFGHLQALHAFAYRLTRNPKDAEDLVQETFLRAYRFFDKFERGTNMKAWLFRILKNTFINEYRRRKSQPAEVDFDKLEGVYEKQLEELSGVRVENPETALERTLMAEDIEEALGAIPEEYRMVVMLVLIEGFTYQEAADALEIPVGTVMSRLHRGRKHLQAKLIGHARARGLGLPEPPDATPPECATKE